MAQDCISHHRNCIRFYILKIRSYSTFQRNLVIIKCFGDLNQHYYHEKSDIHILKGTFKYIVVRFFSWF